MQYKKYIKFVTSIFLTVGLSYSVIFAWVNLGDVVSGDSLTHTLWNNLVAKINENGNKLSPVTNLGDNIGIGTTSPKEKLDVDGHIIGTPIMGNWYPNNVDGPTSMGTTFVSFNAEFDVTAPSYFTNLGGTTGIKIEKSGYYHIEMRTLVYLGGAGDYGHLYLMKNGVSIDADHAFPAVSANWEDRYSSWKGWVNVGDIITSKVYHQTTTLYAYHGSPIYTRLTIEKLD